MIVWPEGWRRIALVGTDMFASPDRRQLVRYRMRSAPLRRVADVIDATLGELSEWQTHAVGARERIVTHEGEHAYGIAVAGRWLGDDARRYVGVIYGDDFYDVLDVIALGDAPIDARGRVLVHGASLHLGVRRRRYFYERPPGWHGHATGLTTHWFPPMFPARPATIIVYPANPTNEQPQAVLEMMIAHHASLGAELREIEPAVAITARHDLAGLHWTLACIAPDSPRIARDLVVFARRSFTYALQLDVMHGRDLEARAQFLMLVRSVEPVPVGIAYVAGEHDTAAVFSHYT